MFTHYRTEGIIIKKDKRFEADEHLTIYTKDFGKVGVIGKSIRKIKSKLRSSAELFCYSEIEFIRGRHYNILTASELTNSFPKIKSDLGKLSLAYRISFLVTSFLPEEEKDIKLWNFIKKSFSLLDFLNKKEDKKQNFLTFYYYFTFHFLAIIGYKPEINECVIDGKKAQVFSPREGGMVCRECFRKLKDPFTVKLKDTDKNFLNRASKESFEEFISQNHSFSSSLETLFKNYIAVLPSRNS